MKTTKKQLANFAIEIVKEILNKDDENIKVEYGRNVTVWFFNKVGAEGIHLFWFDDLKTNKDKFKKAILKIRGIIK